MNYDYKAGKKRVDEILNSNLEVIESSRLPEGDELTFSNAYKSWIMAIFVDIRNSTTLMSSSDQVYVAKVVRSFTSEIIEILRGDDRLREIGIRGDCVYAIYTTPKQADTYEIFEKAIWINTYIKMLNAILRKRKDKKIEAGIGIALGNDHVIKAGRKNVGINSVVWMGDAVSKAAHLADYGEKEISSRMVVSGLAYDNLIKEFERREKDKHPANWFHASSKLPYNSRYCNIIMAEMNSWIDDGMPD